MRHAFVFSVLLLALSSHAHGESDGRFQFRGLSVYGNDREGELPLIIRDSVAGDGKGAGGRGFITIQFDVLGPEPPRLTIRFYHCNRDWVPDDNMFVQSEHHGASFILDYQASPGGVKGYSYRYTNRFPDPGDAVRFDYSGNWIFRILDEGGTEVFDEGRFFVVDRLMPVSIHISNTYLPDNPSPLNQSHRVDVRVGVADETEAQFLTTADLYENRRLHNPRRIDANDRDPHTMVEGYGRGYRLFSADDLLPGNEYRTLDLSNVTMYPNGSPVRLVTGADQARMFWRTGKDRDGTAALNRFTGINSDYLDVLFRLDLTDGERRAATAGGREIFLAGPFNQWNPRAEERLAWNENERTMSVRKTLRRGIYDYQYITGLLDPATGEVRDQDWTVIEGNDWRTVDSYIAVVYYHDPRYGGFDRITAFVRGVNQPSGR